MLDKYKNIDRRIKEPKLEPIDAIMLTLDAEEYLEKTLNATYREVPINKFFVVDGGSKDRTVEILKKYPRMEIYIRPDIRTTGKGFEFLLNKVTTPWIASVDCAKVPNIGWYDEMLKHQNEYDFYGSKRIVHYEFEREDTATTDMNKRPVGGPWLIRKEAVKNYHVDDDYAWRVVDIILRQTVEKNGYKYGAVPTAEHICYVNEKEKYKSSKTKRGVQLVFKKPETIVLNKKNWNERLEMTMRALVKYVDPEYCPNDVKERTFLELMKIDNEWIKNTNMKWYTELKKFKKTKYIKAFVIRMLYNSYKKVAKRIDKMAENYVG